MTTEKSNCGKKTKLGGWIAHIIISDHILKLQRGRRVCVYAYCFGWGEKTKYLPFWWVYPSVSTNEEEKEARIGRNWENKQTSCRHRRSLLSSSASARRRMQIKRKHRDEEREKERKTI